MFAGQIAAGQAIRKSRRIGRQQIADAMDERRPLEAVLQEASGCKVCIERKDVWEQCLTTNGHGCSACKKVFEAKTWNAKMLRAGCTTSSRRWRTTARVPWQQMSARRCLHEDVCTTGGNPPVVQTSPCRHLREDIYCHGVFFGPCGAHETL